MRVSTLPAWTAVLPLVTLWLTSSVSASPITVDSLKPRQDHPAHAHEHDMHHGDANDVVAGMSGMSAPVPEASSVISDPKPTPPDPHGGHSHGSHAAPLIELNDTDIHRWHSYPVSYLAADFRLREDQAIFGDEFEADYGVENASGHLGWAVLHVMGFYSAYFGLLPLSLALRAGEHPWHYITNGAFLVLAVLGWLAGAAYNVATPDRYKGSTYPIFANILLLTSLVLAIIDSLGLIQRAVSFWRSQETFTWQGLKREIFRSDDAISANRYEMVGLVDEPGRLSEEATDHQVVFALGDDEDEEEQTVDPTRAIRPSLQREWSQPSRHSTGSDGTLHEHENDRSGQSSPFSGAVRKQHAQEGAYDDHEAAGSGITLQDGPKAPVSRLARSASVTLTVVRRFQVVFAYVTMIVGLSTYSGMCRGTFLASCAAHYIKGSIFFWYGVLTFARYLGAYADLGWAWNRRPGSTTGPTAEMVECSVIFLYGISNTWLERLGSHTGDPYTVKQVQHISIAVMFWFAGLSGILLESKTIRRILASAKGRQDPIEPSSYAFSFNPLPALVIAVTGLAMAAHHQTYLFQVEIHALWGILLAGGSVARCLTYFFLWLRPPTESTLPSRPPTEIITSFGWAAGGIVFMLSNEEIAFAAMRAHFDDKMAFLNFTIALTALIFCWTVVVMAVKGWAVMRVASGGQRVLA